LLLSAAGDGIGVMNHLGPVEVAVAGGRYAAECRSNTDGLLTTLSATHMDLRDEQMVIMSKRLPDEQEAIVGAGVPNAASIEVLSGADAVAGTGRYGVARSLAVLALEESVKARTLGAIAATSSARNRPGFSDKLLAKIVCSGHRERHSAGFFQHLATTFPDAYGQLMLGMSIEPAEAAKIVELLALLVGADKAKQAGFYSDFDPDTGSWSSPVSVTEAEFTKIHVLIADYVTETQRQFDEFTQNSSEERAAAES
jgi:AbiV family abortive infection protein